MNKKKRESGKEFQHALRPDVYENALWPGQHTSLSPPPYFSPLHTHTLLPQREEGTLGLWGSSAPPIPKTGKMREKGEKIKKKFVVGRPCARLMALISLVQNIKNFFFSKDVNAPQRREKDTPLAPLRERISFKQPQALDTSGEKKKVHTVMMAQIF